MVEVIIDGAGINLMTYERVLTLKEETGNCYMPIYIGSIQDDVIKKEMAGLQTKAVDEFLAIQPGVIVESIAINRLEDGIFYAHAYLSEHGNSFQVDCPTALAIAVALRANVPILVEETILEKAGVVVV